MAGAMRKTMVYLGLPRTGSLRRRVRRRGYDEHVEAAGAARARAGARGHAPADPRTAGGARRPRRPEAVADLPGSRRSTRAPTTRPSTSARTSATASR